MSRYPTKRYVHIEHKTSSTLNAVLAFVYRKEHLLDQCGKYADSVIEGLQSLDLVKKVSSKKGIFYFKTDKAQNFKAIDFAKEFLWEYHNKELRCYQDNKRYIFCFDQALPKGKGLVEVEEAIKNNYI